MRADRPAGRVRSARNAEPGLETRPKHLPTLGLRRPDDWPAAVGSEIHRSPEDGDTHEEDQPLNGAAPSWWCPFRRDLVSKGEGGCDEDEREFEGEGTIGPVETQPLDLDDSGGDGDRQRRPRDTAELSSHRLQYAAVGSGAASGDHECSEGDETARPHGGRKQVNPSNDQVGVDDGSLGSIADVPVRRGVPTRRSLSTSGAVDDFGGAQCNVRIDQRSRRKSSISETSSLLRVGSRRVARGASSSSSSRSDT